jgi:hypothetical protein
MVSVAKLELWGCWVFISLTMVKICSEIKLPKLDTLIWQTGWYGLNRDWNKPTQETFQVLYKVKQPTCYIGSVATDHITSDLDKLVVRESYSGQDQVHTANGTCMMIKHVDQFVVSTLYRYILLKNILHVPQAANFFVSLHLLTSDNDIFLSFT